MTMCIWMCICVRRWMCIYLSVCMYGYVCILLCVWCAYGWMCVYMDVCVCVDGVYVYVWMCVYVWIGMCKSEWMGVYAFISQCVHVMSVSAQCSEVWPASCLSLNYISWSRLASVVRTLLLALGRTDFFLHHPLRDWWSWCPSPDHSLLMMLWICSASTSGRNLRSAEVELVACPSTVSCKGCEKRPWLKIDF